jgi:hypothetical protein
MVLCCSAEVQAAAAGLAAAAPARLAAAGDAADADAAAAGGGGGGLAGVADLYRLAAGASASKLLGDPAVAVDDWVGLPPTAAAGEEVLVWLAGVYCSWKPAV